MKKPNQNRLTLSNVGILFGILGIIVVWLLTRGSESPPLASQESAADNHPDSYVTSVYSGNMPRRQRPSPRTVLCHSNSSRGHQNGHQNS